MTRREEQLEAEVAHYRAALEIASKFWREEMDRTDVLCRALENIAGGEVPLGQYSEMIQAVEAYAQDALDG